ncbi:MAG: hypothetical protein IJ448_01005 [Oscillospiraceae bacterium]|nr:hypothetical protein [Oscillospiraceae bacterium]
MKYLRITVVILLAAALLWGCSEKKYRFVEDESGDYILCPYDNPDEYFSGFLDYPPLTIYFSSPEEMRSDIKNGNFTDDERRAFMWIMSFYGEKDKGKLNVCDLDNMRIPTYPSDCQEYRIAWQGTKYFWEVQIDKHASAKIIDYELIYGAERSSSQYEADFAVFNLDEYLKGTSLITSVETEEDRNAQVVYWYTKDGEIARIEKIYTFNADGTEYHVWERYDDEQATIPSKIRVMYQQNERYTKVSIMGLSERPPIEYLAQFGSVPEK